MSTENLPDTVPPSGGLFGLGVLGIVLGIPMLLVGVAGSVVGLHYATLGAGSMETRGTPIGEMHAFGSIVLGFSVSIFVWSVAAITVGMKLVRRRGWGHCLNCMFYGGAGLIVLLLPFLLGTGLDMLGVKVILWIVPITCGYSVCVAIARRGSSIGASHTRDM